MSIIIALVLIALLFIFILMKPSKVIYIKLAAIPMLCILFILCLIIQSEASLKSALNGVRLWANVVVPSLFPFFVASEILNSTNFIRVSAFLFEPVMRPLFNVPGSGSFALTMGVISGYPVGAKITCDLKKKGELTKYEAERLLAFTNNSGPLFVIGAIGTGMYGSSRFGVLLFVCHLLACFSVGVLFRFYRSNQISFIANRPHSQVKNRPYSQINNRRPGQAKNRPPNCPHNCPPNCNQPKSLHNFDFGTLLGNAVKNSISTILLIGGFIVVFSVIIELLTKIGVIKYIADLISALLSPLGFNESIIRGVLSGVFEITTGSNLISSASGISILQQLPAASLVIGWAGLSVHFQVISIAEGSGISVRPYIFGKLIHGFLSALYTWVGLKLLNLEMLVMEPVLGSGYLSSGKWLKALGASAQMLAFWLAIFSLAYLALKIATSSKQQGM